MHTPHDTLNKTVEVIPRENRSQILASAGPRVIRAGGGLRPHRGDHSIIWIHVPALLQRKRGMDDFIAQFKASPGWLPLPLPCSTDIGDATATNAAQQGASSARKS